MKQMTRGLPQTWGQDMGEALCLGSVLTATSYVLAYLAHWPLAQGWMLWLEVFAVWTQYVCTWLCVRQRRINYPIGAISSVAYAVLFWQIGLLGSATLNLYLMFQLVYGWFRWRSDDNARPVTFVRLSRWGIYLAATALAYEGAQWIWNLTNTTVVWTDIVILIFTILAQFLLDNKKIETWLVWVVVNCFAIWTYFNQELYLVGFQYCLFLVNTVVGFLIWRGAMNAQSVRLDDGHAADHGTSAADPVRS